MVSFAPLDWLVFAAFVAGILALGFSVKLREAGILQFLAAGRSLTLPLFVTTLVSTWYGGILGIGESVSYFGLGTILLLGVPYYAFALIYALFYARRVREADQISIPERMGLVFGKKNGVIAGGLIFLLGVPAAHALMIGTLIQSFTGWSLVLCIVLAGIVGAIFLWKGGLLADVRVSGLAFIMMYVGFAVMVVANLSWKPPSEAWSGLGESLNSWIGGVGVIPIVTFFILGAWTLIDPGFHQRVASAKDPATSFKGVLVSIGFWMLFDVLSITTGMYAMSRLDPIPANPLLIFPLFGDMALPAGLKAVFFCGMLGTILSAMVGYTLVSGASIGRDIVSRLKSGYDETQWTRIGLVLSIVVAIILATQIQSVVSLWYAWGGAVIGALLIPVSLSYGLMPKWRPNSGSVSLAVIVASVVSFVWMGYGLATNNPYLNVRIPESWKILGLGGTDISIGTLLPGLIISAIILAFGPKKDENKRYEPVSE